MRVLELKTEIQEALSSFSDRLSRDFGVKPKKNQHNNLFKGIHPQYWMSVNIDSKWNGITLYGPAFKNSRRLLEATVNTPETGATRSAARLVEIEGQIELLHDGRVSHRDDRPEPKFREKIELQGRQFNRLGPLAGSTLFENMILFHENRFSASPKRSTMKSFHGDFGPANGCERSAAIISAKHSPLCEAFVKQIPPTDELVQPPVRPDIFFSFNGKRYLIEAKPDSGFHSIVTAVGQLIVYSKACRPDVRVLLSPTISDNILESNAVREVLADHGIAHVVFEVVNGNFRFSGLEQIGLGKELH